ncbi:unnamed protein product [Closterium sp. NIES-64]|nr:unnamed protein product [Closterium sp. NIES-64]
MYAVSISDEGDCYRCFPPDPGIGTTALGACDTTALLGAGEAPLSGTDEAALSGTSEAAPSGAGEAALSGTGEAALSGTTSASASLTFTLDCGASRSFFRDRTTLTPLGRPVAVSLADPSGGPVLSHFSTVLPCPAAPSGVLSGLYLPSFSTNLVSGAALQDAGVHQFTPASQRVTHCTDTRTGRHLATFSRRPGSSLYTLTTESPPVPASGQVAASGQVFAAASRSLAPFLRGQDLPVSLTLHMDVWGPARVRGQGHERYFLLVVDDYSRFTTVFPLRSKGDVTAVFDRLDPHQPLPRGFMAGEGPYLPGPPVDWEGWQFYHPSSRRVLSSQDVTFDESVPFYCLFPYRTPSLPPPPDFLTPSSRLRLMVTLVLLRVLSLGVLTLGVLYAWVLSLGVTSLGVLRLELLSLGVLSLGGAASGAAELGGAESGGATSGAAAPGGAASGAAELGCAEPAVAGPPLELREWFARRWRRTTGAGASSAAEAAGAASPGAAGPAGPPGAGAAEGVGAESAAVCLGGGPAAGMSRGPAAGGAVGAGAAAEGSGAAPAVSGVPARPRPYFVPLLQQVLGLPRFCRVSAVCPVTVPVIAGLPTVCSLSLHWSYWSPLFLRFPTPESNSLRAASPTLVDFAARCRLDYAASLVAESASVCPPSVRGECALGTDVLEDRQEEFQCLAAASPHLASVLLAPEGDPDALDIPTSRSYAEAVEGPYSSQWQAAMDAEMASWKSTGTYVDEVPPPGANIVSGMWIFRVKRPPGSPPVFKARYVARGFSQWQGVDYFQTFSPTPKMTTLWVLLHIATQRDYEPHSLDFSTAFLQGSLHEEIWLRRTSGFTGTFPPGTQWSLRRPVYGLRQAPREWHDTLRTTLAALGFAPSTADPSLFLRIDTSLPPFYMYVDDLVFPLLTLLDSPT